MLESILLLLLAAVVSYLIGTINFSKIIAWHARRKDITKLGSKNPGAMNMLRQFGLGLALLTFIAEVLKSGLTCLVFDLIYDHFQIWGGGSFVYYLAGFFLMLGYNFPVWSKFKGGKGVASLSGIFLFSPIWYVGLAWFAVCFVLFIIIDIGSVISLTFTGGLTIATTCFAWLVLNYNTWLSIYVTAIVWALYLLILIKHRGNIYRLFHHEERKVEFKDKLKKVFCHKEKDESITVQNVEENQNSDSEDEKIAENNEKTSENNEKLTESNENIDNKG